MTRSAPERIAQAATVASDLVAEALHGSGTTQTAAARAMGRKRQHVGEMADPDQARSMTLRDIMAAPAEFRRALVELLAAHDGRMVYDPPEVAEVSSDLTAAASAQRESSEAVAALLEGVADGHLTRAEGARLEREADEAIASLLVIRERGRMAVREGVIGLTAVEGGAA